MTRRYDNVTELEIVSNEPRITAHGRIRVRHWDALPVTEYARLSVNGYPRWLGEMSPVETAAGLEKAAALVNENEMPARDTASASATAGETIEERLLREAMKASLQEST